MMGFRVEYIAFTLALLAFCLPLTYAAQPTIEQLLVYDVTNVSDPLTNTTYLVTSGLNTTALLQTNYKYRIEFNATFDTAWTADSSDQALHENLNTSWIVESNEIRVKNGTDEFTGGTFSNGVVNWTLTGVSVEANQNITFLYIVNTSVAALQSVTFSINDTNNGAVLATDNSTFDVRTPYLFINLTTPPLNTIVGQNLTFRVNATINCIDGHCGTIDAYARYNASSSSPDTFISTTIGITPFYIVSDTNPKVCGTLANGTSCTVSWTVNATGNLNDTYHIDVFANGTNITANNSDDGSVLLGKIFRIQLGFSILDFGALNPGAQAQPASDNAIGYNITVRSDSNPVERLWIKGTNLSLTNQAGTNCTEIVRFNPVANETQTVYPCRIPATSMLWSRSPTDVEQRQNITETYNLVNTDLLSIPPSTNLTSYFWINVPYGIYFGGYNGTITFLANQSDG